MGDNEYRVLPDTVKFEGLNLKLSIGDFGQIKLFDHVSVTWPATWDDKMIKVGGGLLNVSWLKYGNFWIENSVNASGATYRYDSGGEGSMEVKTELIWALTKGLSVTGEVTMETTLRRDEPVKVKWQGWLRLTVSY